MGEIHAERICRRLSEGAGGEYKAGQILSREAEGEKDAVLRVGEVLRRESNRLKEEKANKRLPEATDQGRVRGMWTRCRSGVEAERSLVE